MKPSRDREDALVDLVDVILVEGAMLQADVIISVADIPLIGLQLRAALAGMSTMTEYGFFTEWDYRHRQRALDAESTAGGSSRGLSRGDRVALESSRPEESATNATNATNADDESVTGDDSTSEINSSSTATDSSSDAPEN